MRWSGESGGVWDKGKSWSREGREAERQRGREAERQSGRVAERQRGREAERQRDREYRTTIDHRIMKAQSRVNGFKIHGLIIVPFMKA